MIVQGRLLVEADRIPEPGWVAIEAAQIVEVRTGDPPERPIAGDRDAIICPGFTDAHLHLPQIDSVGCEYSDLLEWLDEVVFPAEIRWADAPVAAAQAAFAYRRMLRAGTLQYAGYLTSHATGHDAVRAAHALMPLRGFAGQVLMDRHAPPALLGQPAAPALASDDGRLRPSCNPRFAIACGADLLRTAGAEAARTGMMVQTHLAEQRGECDAVRALFPDAPHYTGVYDAAGLLTPRTLLAHCVHLGADEWSLIAERQSVVVHCPGANTFLQSGLFDLAAATDHGVRLALGSDVAAGPDLAMPRVARAMIEVAKMRAMSGLPTPVPCPADAWRMITEGNADALGLADAGRLAPGGAADLLVLRPPVPVDEHLVGRLIYTWRDDFIAHRIVAGTLLATALD